MFEVYLAGRISGLSFEEATKSRKHIAKELNKSRINCRNPMRGKSVLKNEVVIDEKVVLKEWSVQEVILRDLHDIDRSNVVLVLTGEDPSWGTCGEFWYATWVAKKPTLVISSKHKGGWLDYYATKIVPTVEEAISVLVNWRDYWDNGDKVYEQD